MEWKKIFTLGNGDSSAITLDQLLLSEVSVNVTAKEFESTGEFGSIYKQFSLSDLPIING